MMEKLCLTFDFQFFLSIPRNITDYIWLVRIYRNKDGLVLESGATETLSPLDPGSFPGYSQDTWQIHDDDSLHQVPGNHREGATHAGQGHFSEGAVSSAVVQNV